MAAILAAQQQQQGPADAVPPPTEAVAVAKAVKLAGHGQAVTDLAFDRAADVLWSAAADGTVRRWPLGVAAAAAEPPVLTVTNRDGQPEGISRFALYYPSPKVLPRKRAEWHGGVADLFGATTRCAHHARPRPWRW